MQDKRPGIIVALDVDSLDEARRLVELLHPHITYFKVGPRLAVQYGMRTIAKTLHRSLSGRHTQLFYDGKLNDTPDTVRKTAETIAALGIHMLTVHASGGLGAMRAAVEGVRPSYRRNIPSLVFAVTVLSSLDDDDSQLIFGASARAKVLQFAHSALIAGCTGIVCSPRELELLQGREEFEHLKKIVPGVRPHWAPSHDQKCVMTPWQAVKAGADFLVVGRPIFSPPSSSWTPVDAVKRIQDEIASA